VENIFSSFPLPIKSNQAATHRFNTSLSRKKILARRDATSFTPPAPTDGLTHSTPLTQRNMRTTSTVATPVFQSQAAEQRKRLNDKSAVSSEDKLSPENKIQNSGKPQDEGGVTSSGNPEGSTRPKTTSGTKNTTPISGQTTLDSFVTTQGDKPKTDKPAKTPQSVGKKSSASGASAPKSQ
jgi:hypothetical protein